MRRFAANYIYTVGSEPLKNGIVETDDKGKIVGIIDTKGDLKESRNLEFYNGVIVPGFINTHCHLELSELKGKLTKKTSLPNFLKQIFEYKKAPESEQVYREIEKNDLLMRRNGIVAVGDISNNNKTIAIKKSSKIYYHTFIEAIGINQDANDVFTLNKQLFDQCVDQKLSASIVPHAPYSVSRALFQRIKQFAEENNSILSIHNQETVSENEMFISKKGELRNSLQLMGVDVDRVETEGKNSLETISDYLPKNNTILFVHNTFSEHNDIEQAAKKFPNAFWCLCPLSNLFIENRLPDISGFANYFDKLTLGTDSLASNDSLSILDEMKVIAENFSDISFENLLQWATLNAAKALKIDTDFGSIEIGKTPGLNLITNFDFVNKQITKKSEIQVLI